MDSITCAGTSGKYWRSSLQPGCWSIRPDAGRNGNSTNAAPANDVCSTYDAVAYDGPATSHGHVITGDGNVAANGNDAESTDDDVKSRIRDGLADGIAANDGTAANDGNVAAYDAVADDGLTRHAAANATVITTVLPSGTITAAVATDPSRWLLLPAQMNIMNITYDINNAGVLESCLIPFQVI